MENNILDSENFQNNESFNEVNFNSNIEGIDGGPGGPKKKKPKEDSSGLIVPKKFQSLSGTTGKKGSSVSKYISKIENDEKENQEIRGVLDNIKKQKEIKDNTPVNIVEDEILQNNGQEFYNQYKKDQKRLQELQSKTYAGNQMKVFKTLENKYQIQNEKDDNLFEKGMNFLTNTFLVKPVNVVNSMWMAGVEKYRKGRFTDAEEIEYQKLQKKVNEIEKPVLQKQKAELQKKYDAVAKKYGIDQNKTFYNTFSDKEDLKYKIVNNYQTALDEYDNAIENGGLWSGLVNDRLGMLKTIDDVERGMFIKKMKEKEDKGETFTEDEMDLLESYHVADAAVNGNLNSNKTYQLGKSLRQSVEFIAESAIGAKGVRGVIGGTVKEGVELSARKKAVKEFAENVLSPSLMPSTYSKASDKYSSSLQKIQNIEGQDEFMITDAKKKVAVKNIDLFLKIANSDIEMLKAKENLSEEELAQLEELQIKKENALNMKSQLVDEYGNLVESETGIAKSLAYGYTENLKENITERYVGGFVDKVGGKIFKKIPGEVNNPFLRNVQKLNDKMHNIKGLVDDKLFSSGLGKVSKNLYSNIGPAKMIHSLPSEMVEEITTQLMPSIGEDYAKQINELAKPDFYAQVIASTLLMGGGVQVLGGGMHYGMHYKNMLMNKEYRNAVKSRQALLRNLREQYKNIDKAVSDDQLAKDIAMNTLGSIHDITEYRARIADLRNPNGDNPNGETQEERNKKANLMERNSFINMALQAIETGTENDLNRSLRIMSENSKLSEETRNNALVGIDRLKRFGAIVQKNQNLFNRNELTDLEIRKELMSDTMSSMNEKYESSKQGLIEKINEFNETRESDNQLTPLNFIAELKNSKENESVSPVFADFISNFGQDDKVVSFIDNDLNMDMLDGSMREINKEIEYQRNPRNKNKIQQEVKNREVEQIINNVTEENQDDVRAELERRGVLTPENELKIKDIVQQRVLAVHNPSTDNAIKENVPEFDEPDVENPEQTITNTISNLPTTVVNNSNSQFTQVSEDNLFESDNNLEFTDPDAQEQINNANALTLQPLSLDDSNPKHKNLIDGYEKVITGLNKDINNQLGRDMTSDEAFALFANAVGLGMAEQNFNFFKKAFEKSGIENKNNWDSIYNKYFEKLNGFKAVTNDTPVPVTVKEVEVSDSKTNKEIQKNNTPVDYTQNNHSIVYLGRKIAVAMNKIPFLGVKYEAVFDELTNTVKYVDTENGELNTEGSNNLNVILNPDILVSGKKFTLEIPDDWQSRIVSVWEKNEAGFLAQKQITMSEWMMKQGVEYGSKEWIDKVPMNMIVDGNNIGYGVHDTAWWNRRNVADFTKATINDEPLTPEQAELHQTKVIQEGREMTSAIRNAVFNGNNEMIITEREEGHTLSHNNNQVKSISSSNPDAQIAIGSPQGFIINKDDNGNKYFTGHIINEKEIVKAHAYMISRLGTMVKDGKNVPTYVAHKVLTNYNQQSLQELAKSRIRMYNAADILNKTGNHTNPTQEQINWARSVADQVKKMTGVSIDNVTLKGNKPQYDGMSQLKEFYPVTITDNDVKGYTLLPQMQGFEKKALPIVHADGSVTNYKSESGEGYKAMVMDNLYTNKKFHEITDSEGNKKYILDVQPRIKFDIADKSLTPVQNNVQNNNTSTQSNVRDELKIDETENTQEDTVVEKQPIESISHNQRRRVVQYFFNKILSSVDVSQDFTNRDIVNKIQSAFDDHLTDMRDNPDYQEEYKYLLDNKDSILGIGSYSNNINTVKLMLEQFLSQEFDTEVDTETGIETDNEVDLSDNGIFEKNNNKAAFENDVRTSLSTKMKMFFSGIQKTNKQETEAFGNLDEYYTADEIIGGLQDMLVDISNDPKSFRNKIENQVRRNKDEFGFLEQILEKFDSADIEIQKELLFRLNQTKNEMFFVMYSKSKSGKYTLQVYDANSKNPLIKTKQQWQENIKQSSLIINNGDNYRVKESVANSLIQQFDSWKGRYMEVPNNEYIDWLSFFGIEVNDKTIQDYKEGLVEGAARFEGIFDGGIFSELNKNLKEALSRQVKNPSILFKYKAESKTDTDSFNILMNNNSGYLKTMIAVEVKNTFNVASSMYIAHKTINAFSQPNYTSEQLRKLKDTSNPLVENLSQSPFSKNSMLLNLIQTNDKVRESLGIGYVSLESLKKRKQRVYQDSGIVDLSSQDYDLLLQGFFQSEGAYFANEELKGKGISLREIKMTFPTLSDSSQMFIMNTVGLNLNKSNFTFSESGVAEMDDNVVEVLYNQLVKPDLDRIEMFIKSGRKTDIQGHNVGSQMFTMLGGMNTLQVSMNGNNVDMLRYVHDSIQKGKTSEDIFNENKEAIYALIRNTIKNSVDSKIKYDGNTVTGSWVDNGFVDNKNNVHFFDNKYLEKKGLTNSEKLQVAAYDYTVNYFINQAQIQMLFAGDINNYVQDKMESKFHTREDGTVDVTRPLGDAGQTYTDILKATSVNMSKRLKELISPGNRIAESKDEKYIQLMVNDVEESSLTIHSIVKEFYPETYEANKDKLDNLKRLENNIRNGIRKGESVTDSNREYKSELNNLQKLFPDIKDYFKITATDAQEYTTWKEHLHILFNQGRVSSEIYDSITEKLESQSKDGINESNILTKEEKKIVFQPIKPLHAGMYFEDVKDMDGNVIGKNQRYVYVKTSSFPLLPQMTQNMELDVLRKNIENLERNTGKKVRVSYQSGNKVGAVKSAVNMSELYSDNYNTEFEERLLGSSVILDRENFSIQQDKPFKTDKNIKNNKRDEINRGTQFEKIILGNGINKDERKIFENNFDNILLQSLDIEPGDKISGKDLYKIYTHLYQEEQKILRRQLMHSLGLNFDGDWSNNIETLEHIKNALDKRLSNKQDKEILQLTYIVTNKVGDNYVNEYYNKENIDGKNVYKNVHTGEIKQLNEIKPTTAEFNIPLWMSPNSRKFESVLNSIVNNKLINLKLPGFSSPVASQEGFKYMDEADLTDKSGIVFTDKYDPKTGLKATHNDDGSLSHAQVMVASKFRIAKKDEVTGKYKSELINMSDYTKTLEDGRVVIDNEKVPQQLLQMFSFRIPTSAHQSGAVIEIVGFLPHEQGDLMVVPKDHTTQIGEDYDIDTRYVYQQNYRVDKNGNIKKIDAEYIQNKITQLDNSFNDNQEWNQITENILNIFDAFRENEEVQEIFKQDNVSKERKHQIVKDALQHQLIENQLVDVYKSVFSSTDNNMQKMIGSTLSTKFAEDTAEIIDEKVNSSDNINFSIFDDNHQKSILRLGASGKLGIGVHSNWVVLNSLFQQMENAPKLVYGYNQETGEAIPWNMRIGNFMSDGQLGRIEALQPLTKKEIYKNFKPRTLSVINMESQNSSTDNQKLQIMGRRNENKYTINVFALMSNLGFDKDVVTLDSGDTKELSLPSLFISQPIIRRYVQLKEQYSSITSEYQDNKDLEIVKQLFKEFGEGVDAVDEGFGPKMNKEQMNAVQETELTGQKLYNSLTGGNNAQQWAVFEKFQEFNKKAEDISKVQQLMNIDSSGLGISFFNTIDKKNNLAYSLTDNSLKIDGINKMFGNKVIVPLDEQETREPKLFEEGYIKVDDTVYMKPTSPLNAKLINSIGAGYNLWRNVLPFEDKYIDQQITDIVAITGKEDGTKAATELKYKIISEMKDFVYSYSNIGIFNKPVNEERESLFIDTDSNESLASYLNKLKKDKNDLFNQPFFKELEFVLNKGNEPSLVKYSTNDRTSYNKNLVHNMFTVLAESDTLIPNLTNDPKYDNYKWSDLAKDLTKYALLSNQENGAIGFRSHIPMTVFNKYGITDSLRKYSGIGQNASHNLLFNGDFKALTAMVGSNRVIDGKLRVLNNSSMVDAMVNRINTKFGQGTLVYDKANKVINVNSESLDNVKSIFIRQFFQHNPNEAKKLNITNIKQWKLESDGTTIDELNWFRVNDTVATPEYYSIRDSKSGTFVLFELDSTGVYRRINTLGGFGFNEYSPFTYNQKSMAENNNELSKPISTVPPIENIDTVSTKETKENTNMTDIVSFMENMSSNSKFKPIADLIKGFAGDVKINIIDMKEMGNALYVPLSDKNSTVSTDIGVLNRGEVYVNADLVKSGNTEKLNYAIMEEVVHSITVNELNKYIDTSKSYLDKSGQLIIDYKTDVTPPAHISKLISLYKQGAQHILNKMTQDSTLEEAVTRINEQKKLFVDLSKGIQTNTDTVDPLGENFKRNVYRTLNIAEFIAGVMVDDKFRNEMNNVQYKSTGESILSQFAKVIAKIVEKLSNGNRVENSITTNTYDAVMALLEYNQSTNNSGTVKESNVKLSDVDAQAEQLIQEFSSPDNIQELSNPDFDYDDTGETSEISLQPIDIDNIEGIEEVFRENPELASIGTKEQYSQYLDTIFPDSKVKDIVYHGTLDKIESFDKSKIGKNTIKDRPKGFYFTRKNVAENIYGSYPIIDNSTGEQILQKGNLISAIINTKGQYELVQEKDDISGYGDFVEYPSHVVFEPEQIHILGSQADIQGFKDFINTNQNQPITLNDMLNIPTC